MRTIRRKLNIVPGGIPVLIKLNQYDSDYSLVFELYSTDGVFTVPSGSTAKICGTKRSGTGYSADASISGTTVTVTGDVQMTAAAGTNVYEIVLYNGTKKLHSANIILLVERAALDADTITDETIVPELDSLAQYVAAAQESARSAAESAAKIDFRVDAVPTQGSNNAVSSGAVYDGTMQFFGITDNLSARVGALEEDNTQSKSDIAGLTEKVTILSNIPSLTWTYNKIITAQGAINDSQYYAISQIVDCREGDVFYNHTPNSDATSGLSCYHVLYTTTDSKNDTFYQRVGASSTRKMVIPAGVTGYRLLFGRSTSGGVPISSGDAEANVDLEIVRKGPSYEDLNESHKKSIKMLCIGNSFSQDSVAYMPFILRGLADDIKLTLGIAYYGGGGIDDYVGFFDNDTPSVTFNRLGADDDAWVSTSGQTLKQILAAEQWDIVTFQQKSTSQEKWSTYGNLNTLIDDVVGYIATTHGKSVRVGWLMPQIRQSSATADSYANMIECVKKVMQTTPCSFVIPCGTAVQLARQTDLDNLGDGGHLTKDGAHLQEGLPCLLSAYVSAIKMLEFVGREYKSILGESTRPLDAWIDARNIPGQNGDSVGATDANCYLAQKLATQAVKFPYGEE